MRRFVFRGKPINIYPDNKSALAALIKGDSDTNIIASTVATSWRALRRFNIDVLLGRVSSKLNIADHPTRSKEELPYECERLAEFAALFKLFMIVTRAHNNVFCVKRLN